MAYLIIVSLLWGFSFGLVKAEFASLGPATLAAARLLLAVPCFLPFLKPAYRRVCAGNLWLLLTGSVQFGLMYVALFHSFAWLSGHEVALLTIFTPLYVVLAHAVLGRAWPPARFWLTAALAVAGALWIFQPQSLPAKWPGILLMQAANLCFAGGQVAWRKLRMGQAGIRDRDGYALLYIGGFLASLPFALLEHPVAGLARLDSAQWGALVYLGVVASGLGFFLWNAGAVRVNPATLAVFNNLKIPAAIVIAIVFFGEQADLAKLVPGLLVLLAALVWAEAADRRQLTRRN